jgi:small subunit ribosomal protein S6
MQNYESVIIFNSQLDDKNIEAELKKLEGVVKANSGSIEKSDVYGRRRLAYLIKKQEYGIYSRIVFSGGANVVSDLDRQIRLNESIIRHITVKRDRFAGDPDSLTTYLSSSGDSDDFLDGDYAGGDLEDDSDDGITNI